MEALPERLTYWAPLRKQPVCNGINIPTLLLVKYVTFSSLLKFYFLQFNNVKNENGGRMSAMKLF